LIIAIGYSSFNSLAESEINKKKQNNGLVNGEVTDLGKQDALKGVVSIKTGPNPKRGSCRPFLVRGQVVRWRAALGWVFLFPCASSK